MKKLFAVLLISSIPTLAQAASATLNATKKIELKFENQSGVYFSKIKLTPKFYCSTLKPQGFGDAITVVNEANTLFQVSSDDAASATIQHMNSITIEAPKKDRFTNRQSCSVVVYLTIERGYASEANFGNIADVSSTRKNADLTKEFENSLGGEYVLKLMNDGTAWDYETNGRMNVCSLVLFKKMKGELKEVSKSYDFRVDRCKI
ncbi:hypothetical protein [Peredibacter starrii]|uniref:Uncharacterized protein n=1 Tax=Peredibacter starrii TaxID=28202 RepID=A0AAX4HKS6_9BACT|nr:hypothetical protein [Peredibacter starrii]WPU63867.1 hypothetical protein SOO65_14325 [Peredibacter starrii]